MSGPQGSDPTQAWSGQPQSDQPEWRSRRLLSSRPPRCRPGSACIHAAAVSAVPAPGRSRRPTPAAVPAGRPVRPAGAAYNPSAYQQPAVRSARPRPAAWSAGQQPGQYGQHRAVRPAAGSVRPAGAAVFAVRHVGHRGGFQEVTGRHRRHRRPARRHRRRRRSGTRLLEARLLRHHQARRQRRADRRVADPVRRGQRLRRQERQGRQVQQRRQPDGEEG